MLSKDDIKYKKENIDKEEIKYSWNAVTPEIPDKNGPVLRIVFALCPWIIISVFIVLCLFREESSKYYVIILLLIVGIFLSYLIYFLMFADSNLEYKLTKIGIITISQQIIPDGVYTFFRGFAWVGIVICLVAFIVIGPLAFVGAGAFGLMSFGMTSFSPSKHVSKDVFAERMIMFYVKETDSLELRAHPVQIEACMSLYFETEASRKIVEERIKQILPTMACFSVERTKEMRAHPAYVAAIEARRAINPELYS